MTCYENIRKTTIKKSLLKVDTKSWGLKLLESEKEEIGKEILRIKKK